jgi:DNA-binding transcriptional LysR family regulator
MTQILEAVDQLRQAVGDQTLMSRNLRIGTVNTANSTLLVPAVQDFRLRNPSTAVEIVASRQNEIQQRLSEGSLDLGLVNALPGDDVPAQLSFRELLHGRPVVCLRADHPLARLESVSIDQLRDGPFIAMRAGYLMHRFHPPAVRGTPAADGVLHRRGGDGKGDGRGGLGVTMLPDYSVADDPLCAAGVLTYRPIVGDQTAVTVLMVARNVTLASPTLRAMQSMLLERARQHRQKAVASQTPPNIT